MDFPMDARIGVLMREGKEVFYKTEGGYAEGSIEAVEASLGIRTSLPVEEAVEARIKAPSKVYKEYDVHLTFQYPAWDEVDGIWYKDISAQSKKDAIKQVRRMAADDGHAVGGRGMYWLKATEKE